MLEGALVTHKGKVGCENLANLNTKGSDFYEFKKRQDCLPNFERLLAERC